MKKIISLLSVLLPSFAFAQTQPITDVNSLSQKLVAIGNVIIYILISLAIIFIIYNIVRYVVQGNDAEKKKEALWNTIYGIIGLAVILSIWGLVNILTGTFRTTPPAQTIPQIQQGSVPVVQ